MQSRVLSGRRARRGGVGAEDHGLGIGRVLERVVRVDLDPREARDRGGLGVGQRRAQLHDVEQVDEAVRGEVGVDRDAEHAAVGVGVHLVADVDQRRGAERPVGVHHADAAALLGHEGAAVGGPVDRDGRGEAGGHLDLVEAGGQRRGGLRLRGEDQHERRNGADQSGCTCRAPRVSCGQPAVLSTCGASCPAGTLQTPADPWPCSSPPGVRQRSLCVRSGRFASPFSCSRGPHSTDGVPLARGAQGGNWTCVRRGCRKSAPSSRFSGRSGSLARPPHSRTADPHKLANAPRRAGRGQRVALELARARRRVRAPEAAAGRDGPPRALPRRAGRPRARARLRRGQAHRLPRRDRGRAGCARHLRGDAGVRARPLPRRDLPPRRHPRHERAPRPLA